MTTTLVKPNTAPAKPKAAPAQIGDKVVKSWDAEAFETVAAAAAGKEAVLEPKFDGIRLLCQVTESGVRLWTRNGNDKAKHAVAIAEEVAREFPVGSWIDAEAITMTVDADGKLANDWGGAQSILGGNPKPLKQQARLHLVVFDLMAHGGIDARSLPFMSRRLLLERIFADGGFAKLALAPQLPATEESHEGLLAAGYEGSMVKRLMAPYASGKRGAGLGKLKGRWTLDAIVTGAKPGEGSFDGLVGAVIFSQHDPVTGELVERGKCSGMTYEMRVWITENLDTLIAKKAVLEVAHNGALKKGGPVRHPRFLRFRTDKDADQVMIHDR